MSYFFVVVTVAVLSVVAGYAFRGLIGREKAKIGARILDAAKWGEAALKDEYEKIAEEIKAKL